MRHIRLTNSERVALVDASDAWRARHRWMLANNMVSRAVTVRPGTYGRRSMQRTRQLHRDILGAGPGDYVFARNGNYLDCRRANLVLGSRALGWRVRNGGPLLSDCRRLLLKARETVREVMRG